MRTQNNWSSNWENSNRRYTYRPYDAMTMSRDEWIRKHILPIAIRLLMSGGYFAVRMVLLRFGVSEAEIRMIQKAIKVLL